MSYILVAQAGGYALSFDGSDDYVKTIGTFALPTSSGTFEGWFWTASGETNNSFWGNTVGAHGQARGLRVNSSSTVTDDIYFYGYSCDAIFTDAFIGLYDQWAHIALALNSSSSVSLYLNGRLFGTETLSGAVSSLQPVTDYFLIGDEQNTSAGTFKGKIDEFRIWNDARTASEIQENMHTHVSSSASDLVAYWQFNENTGTTAYDETSNHHDGTLTNNPTWTTSTAPIGGYALDFDGSNDYVLVSDNDNLDLGTNDLTIEFWMSADSISKSKIFLDKRYSSDLQSNIGYQIRHTGGYIQFQIFNGLSGPVINSSELQNNTGYHIAITLDRDNASGLRIFVNGTESASAVDPTSYNGLDLINNGNLYIGKSNKWNQYYPGSLDEIRIWNDVRTPTEIQENIFKELTGSETGLVAYYKFNEGTGTTADNVEGTSALDGTLTNFSGTYWITNVAPLATTFTSDKTDLISVWSANNSNASSILTVTDSDVSGSNRIAFGHDNGSLSPNTSDKPDGIDRRLNRVWRLEVNAGLTGDLVFECSGLGIGTSSDLRLLEDLDGTFSDATAVSGTYIGTDFTVSGQTFKDGYYYTLASTSSDNSLPVGFSYFCAVAGNERITLKWTTESEIDNLGFNIYRSVQSNRKYKIINGQLIPSAGNSSSRKDYDFIDFDVNNGITYWYKLEDVDYSGNTKLHGPVSAIPMKNVIPSEFRLYPNYPNPFNPVTTIAYDLPEESYVELIVYNIRGERVKTLLKGFQEVGSYQLSWDGRDQNSEILSSGIYFLQISTGKYLKTNKMVFIR
ncbi:MAG: T9SS type A sorting domain-containing protein [Candidatus Marinimicrobia bacterium]|nr:T9SS type A sorting domain-containing protein [Candidatus Neomarinimicrobiota bacterium]